MCSWHLTLCLALIYQKFSLNFFSLSPALWPHFLFPFLFFFGFFSAFYYQLLALNFHVNV